MEDLEYLRDLEHAATEEPWEVRAYEWGYIIGSLPVGCRIVKTPFDPETEARTARRQLADADLMVALRNNAATLLDEARRARKLEAELIEARERIRTLESSHRDEIS